MKHPVGKTVLIVGILLLLLIGTGIAVLYNSKSAQKKVLPQVERIRSLSVVISYDTATVSGEMGVNNPLPADITIDSISYTILHDGDTLGKGSRIPETTLESGKVTYIPLKLNIDFDLLQAKIKALQKQDSTDLDLALDLFFDLPAVGSQKIPIQKTMPVNVPRLPIVEVHSMKVVDFGLSDGVEMEMELKFQNENLQDLHISNIHFTVQADDFLDAEEKLDKTYTIKANATSIHAIPLHLGLKEALKAKVKKQFGDKTWQVTVKGSAEVRSDSPMLQHVSLRFSQTKEVDASQTAQGGKDKDKEKEEKEKEKEKKAKEKEEEKEEDDDKGFLKKAKDKLL